MKKIIMALLITACVVPAYCDDKSDNALYKDFISKVLDTFSGEPNRDTGSTIKVREVRALSQRPVKAAAPAFKPEKYDFTNTTSYGNFKVLVITQSPGSFAVSFASDYPIEQYQIMDTTTKAVSKKEDLNDALTYTTALDRPFEPKYILLLSMYKDGIISQNILPLYKKANVKTAQ